MKRPRIVALLVPVFAVLGCGGGEAPSAGGEGEEGAASETLRIAVIAKSQSNPVFQAARTGAMDAGRALSAERGIDIEVLWQTPVDEDAQEQADKIEQLANQGVDGIAISCSEAGKVTPAIDYAVNERGAHVVCFDSDAPNSARFAYFGIDDLACGQRVMRELATLMGGPGKVAVLAGNQTAPNLQRRVQGVREEAAKHPGIEIVDVFYHKETPQDAASRVEQVMQANPDITGWAMVGGWPLFTSNALKWEPGTVQCVSVDALPAQLAYLESGHVQMLLAQPVYDWGYKSVQLLVDRILDGAVPEPPVVVGDLEPVTADDVPGVLEQWKGWTGN